MDIFPRLCFVKLLQGVDGLGFASYYPGPGFADLSNSHLLLFPIFALCGLFFSTFLSALYAPGPGEAALGS